MFLPRICEILFVSSLLTGACFAQSKVLLADPIFGVNYDPPKVHFERAPAQVEKHCRDLRGERLWVYAHWQQSGIELFILSSLRSQPTGIGVVLQGANCTQIVPAWILTGETRNWTAGGDPPLQLTAAILDSLTSDLLQRYATAFGGKQRFIDAVHEGGRPAADWAPAVRRAFDAYAASR